MHRRPRIAIPMPSTIDAAYNRACMPLYCTAVEQSGGEPVTIPLDGAPICSGDWQGLLLPGSLADVNPARYGQAKSEACGPQDRPREETDRALLEAAERDAKPVLGICYGLQSINVWRGGSLLQDLSVFPVNHAAGAAVGVAHTASFRRDTLLRDIVAGEVTEEGERLPINSSHHQAVLAIGEGLRVAATCPQDGVIEGIEAQRGEESFFLAVQWHPERSFARSRASQALFARFIAEAARRG